MKAMALSPGVYVGQEGLSLQQCAARSGESSRSGEGARRLSPGPPAPLGCGEPGSDFPPEQLLTLLGRLSAWISLVGITGGLFFFDLRLCCKWLPFLSQIQVRKLQLFWPRCAVLQKTKFLLPSPGYSLAKQRITRQEAYLLGQI